MEVNSLCETASVLLRKACLVLQKDSWEIVRGVLIYVIIGIAIWTGIHGFILEGFIETYLQKDNVFAVPLAVFHAVSMGANTVIIVLIATVFAIKWIPLRTVIAFR